MFVRSVLMVAASLTLGACVRSAVAPLADDTIQITTDAAQSCGRSGAEAVAMRRAAIETIQRGYDKFVVLRHTADNSVAGYAPFTASRVGKAGSAIIVTGGGPIYRNSQGLIVKMYRAADPAAANAIAARNALGPQWQETVKESTRTTCLGESEGSDG
jgi:hypothetical protein